MNITEFLAQLRAHAEKPLAIILPNGQFIPAHYHVTEVGHVLKRFIDCGGTRRILETCLLQTWVDTDVDHRLFSGKLATIFDKAGDVLPHHNLPVEVEHETEVVAQYPVESAEIIDGALTFRLSLKHTDCLARGICIPGQCAPNSISDIKASSCCTSESTCC